MNIAGDDLERLAVQQKVLALVAKGVAIGRPASRSGREPQGLLQQAPGANDAAHKLPTSDGGDEALLHVRIPSR
jgi:hypothetical protein